MPAETIVSVNDLEGRGDLSRRALALFRQGRLDAAEAAARDALGTAPGDSAGHNLLGVILKNRSRPIEALAAFDEAHRLDPGSGAPLSNALNIYLAARDGGRAREVAERLLALLPDVAEHQRQYAAAAGLRGDLPTARRHADRAVALDPAATQAWVDGAVYREQDGALDEALRHLDLAAATAADGTEVMRARVAALRRNGRASEAASWLEARLAAEGEQAELLLELARCRAAGDRRGANELLRRALVLSPEDPDILMELADGLDRTRGSDEGANIAEAYALATRRIALGRVRMKDAQVLRTILHRNADFAAARRLGSFERLGAFWAGAGHISALHYHLAQAQTARDRRLLVQWHRQWGRQADRAAAAQTLAAPAVRTEAARVRVGLMSSDLRHHPVAYFALPLIEGFDRKRFELYCYSWNSGAADPVQDRIGKVATAFRLAPGLSDRDAAGLIAADGLDMLFELGGTTFMNKLRVMCWRPARLQASWLGYPHSAGPETIDYILCDPHLRPPDPALLIEKPFELARSWVALGTLGFNEREPVDPATPEERTGRVTFGTMNNPYKVTQRLIACWAAILRAVPGSRFLFVRPEGAVDSFRTNIRAAFEAHGVAPDRIDFTAVRGTHLRHYNDIDVALDTFPQTGGTTTCESLWMGVPTVTLVGEAFFERLSYSNLMNAGLPGLCCFDEAEYVRRAVEVAADTKGRAHWRRTLRTQIRQNPLGRTDWFVRDFQDTVMRAVDGEAG